MQNASYKSLQLNVKIISHFHIFELVLKMKQAGKAGEESRLDWQNPCVKIFIFCAFPLKIKM